MILRDECARDKERTSFASVIAEDVEAICRPLSPDENWTSEIASAVATYCIDTNDGNTYPRPYMNFLFVRGMQAVGMHEEAGVLLESSIEADTVDMVRMLPARSSDANAAWRIVRSRVMRRGETETRRDGTLYVLDLGRLAENSGAALEVVLFQDLRALIESIVDLFERTGGRGVLGIKGLKHYLAQRLCVERQSRALKGLVREAVQFVEAVLESESHRREWANVPDLIRVDL